MNTMRSIGIFAAAAFLFACSSGVAFASGDTGAPTVNAPVAVGGTVYLGYVADTNTAVRLNVSVGSDAVDIGGVIHTFVKKTGGTDIEIGTPHTVLPGEANSKFDLPDISTSTILTALAESSVTDGESWTFTEVLNRTDSTTATTTLGTLPIALIPLINHLYVSGTTVDANNHTFATSTPSFDIDLSHDSILNTLTCQFDSGYVDDCFGSFAATSTANYSYASSTSLTDGTHAFTVVFTDLIGRAATSTISICITTCGATPDTTAPVIAAHAAVFATSTVSSGIAVSYTTPTATDNVDLSVTVNCTPVSGSTFAIGDTTVTCTASDAALNAATPVTFVVHVANAVPAPAPISFPSNGPPVPNAVVAPVVIIPATTSAPSITVQPVPEPLAPTPVAPTPVPVVEKPAPTTVTVTRPHTDAPPVASNPILAPVATRTAETMKPVEKNSLSFLWWIFAALALLAIVGVLVFSPLWARLTRS